VDDDQAMTQIAGVMGPLHGPRHLRGMGWRTLAEAFDHRDANVLERVLAREPVPRAHGFELEVCGCNHDWESRPDGCDCLVPAGKVRLYSPAAINLMARELRSASRKTIAAAARAHAEALDAEGQRERAEGILEALKRESRLAEMLDTRR
jgi:hypothetical protein